MSEVAYLKLAQLLLKTDHIEEAIEVLQASKSKKGMRKPRRTRVKKQSLGQQVLLAAAARANAVVDDPEALNDMIENVLFGRIESWLDKVYSKSRKFKTTRTEDAVSDDQVNYGTYDNPDDVDYYASVDYPAEVTSNAVGLLSPKFFSRDLAIELDREVSPSSAAKKIASDREVLAFASKHGLEPLIRVWNKKYSDPPREDSEIANNAKKFAEDNAEEVEVHADHKVTEILHTAYLTLSVQSINSKLSFVSPWKLSSDTIFTLQARLNWEDYS